MPVKTSTTSLIAVGLASFVAGVLVSRRRCRSCSTDSNVRKWARLYLSGVPFSEDKQAITDEVKKITKQLQEMYIDKENVHPRYRYTLGFITKEITGGEKRIIEVQYYTVRSTVAEGLNYPDKPDAGAKAMESDSSTSRSLQFDTAAPQALQADMSAGLTDHTPPPCPRPRPRVQTKYEVEGWECEY